MDVRRLSLFLAVVDHGSFTGAAAASHLSQPGLSKAIQELEHELGIELFERTGRRVRLSAAGDALVGPARQTLRDLDAARAAVGAVTGLERGRLRLACLPTLADDPTARLVGELRRDHPGIRVELAAPDDPADLLAMLGAGDVELGLTEAPPARPGLAVHPVADQELVVILAPGSPRRAFLPIRALADQPLVATAPGTSSRRVLDEAAQRAGVVLTVAVETAQREAVLPLVLAGAGAAVLPAAVGVMAQRLGAVVMPTRPRLRRRVALVHRAGALAPAAAAFAALIRSTDTQDGHSSA